MDLMANPPYMERLRAAQKRLSQKGERERLRAQIAEKIKHSGKMTFVPGRKMKVTDANKANSRPRSRQLLHAAKPIECDVLSRNQEYQE